MIKTAMDWPYTSIVVVFIKITVSPIQTSCQSLSPCAISSHYFHGTCRLNVSPIVNPSKSKGVTLSPIGGKYARPIVPAATPSTSVLPEEKEDSNNDSGLSITCSRQMCFASTWSQPPTQHTPSVAQSIAMTSTHSKG